LSLQLKNLSVKTKIEYYESFSLALNCNLPTGDSLSPGLFGRKDDRIRHIAHEQVLLDCHSAGSWSNVVGGKTQPDILIQIGCF